MIRPNVAAIQRFSDVSDVVDDFAIAPMRRLEIGPRAIQCGRR